MVVAPTYGHRTPYATFDAANKHNDECVVYLTHELLAVAVIYTNNLLQSNNTITRGSGHPCNFLLWLLLLLLLLLEIYHEELYFLPRPLVEVRYICSNNLYQFCSHTFT